MSQIDLPKKYSNFRAPKNQITVGNEDLYQKYGITAVSLTVEQMPDTSKFGFSIDDAQAKWANTQLFEPNRPVEVKMGYGSTLKAS